MRAGTEVGGAAKEIKSLISASTEQVQNGVKLVGHTGEARTAIVTRVAEIADLMTEISASAKEQAVTLTEVNTAVNQMDQTTQQNAAMVEEATAACHDLTCEAEKLNTLVGASVFRDRGLRCANRLRGADPQSWRTQGDQAGRPWPVWRWRSVRIGKSSRP